MIFLLGEMSLKYRIDDYGDEQGKICEQLSMLLFCRANKEAIGK